MTTLKQQNDRLRRRWIAFALLAIAAAGTAWIGASSEPSKTQTAAQPRSTFEQQVEDCENSVAAMAAFGVDIEKVLGVPSGALDRYYWCVAHPKHFQKGANR